MPNNRFFYRLMRVVDKLSKYKTTVMVMAVVVVFISTYILILPAFTLEKDEALKQGGIDIVITEPDSLESASDSASDAEELPAKESLVNIPDTSSETSEEKTIGGEDPLVFIGDGYSISVTDKDDVLPDGTTISVNEIEQGSDEYLQHLGQTWMEVNKEFLEQEEKRNDGPDDYEFIDIPLINIDDARFFDITLLCNNEAIEPKAPVQMDIEYEDGLKAADVDEQIAGVSHFKKKKVELIEDVETTADGDGNIVDFSYEQSSFSDIGTYVAHETTDNIKPKVKVNLPRSSEGQNNDLEPIIPSKILYPNKDNGQNDGTYTLELSVTGDHIVYEDEDVKKSNVLFIMDRSSSMVTNNTYYRVYDYSSSSIYYGRVGDTYVTLNHLSDGSWIYRQEGPQGPQIYDYDPNNGIYIRGSRLGGEQSALNALLGDLMEKNQDEADTIEISIISFATRAGNNHWTQTEVDWTNGTDPQALIDGVNQNSTASGTNWEEALRYANEVMAAKEAAELAAGNIDEDYYVVFLTDGGPTATTWSIDPNGGNNNGAYYGTSGHYDWQRDNLNRPRNSCEPAYQDATDEAKDLVDAGYKLYNIFTYGTNNDYKYLVRLTNYAYGESEYIYDNVHDDSEPEDYYPDSPNAKKYFTNATDTDKLVEAFQNIFSEITVNKAHAQVKLTDGLTSGAMKTTFTAGNPEGVRYVVKDGNNNELYYVTADLPSEGSEPVVTFHIGEQSYTGELKTNSAGAYDEGSYYSVTVEGTEYKMALASIVDNELTWDLTPIGMLLDDCTYTAEFIVWPNQEAYDYVAGLNNGLEGYSWNDDTAEDSGKGYYTGGVENLPIVKYVDGDTAVYAVLTNTHQELNYSIVTQRDDEAPEVVPQEEIPMDTPDPMPLTATKSQLEKIWNVERDPDIMAKLLYGTDYGDAGGLTIPFVITRDNEATPYITIPLGWDPEANDGAGGYVWDTDSGVIEGDYDGNTYQLGTRWVDDFAIATGLMLSTDRMNELGLDKDAYDSVEYDNDTYYILETGHDYTISEPGLSYEFDFIAPVYHPMLVDGVLKSVEFEGTGSSRTIKNITDIEVDSDGVSTLKIENTLRGYIHLNKVVVDKDDNPVRTDETKFEYYIELNNDDAPFDADHIPWYGINNLFYHDTDFNYYQAIATEGKYLILKDEAGNTFNAECVNGDAFDEDAFGPTVISYQDGEETKTIQLYGNQMQESTDKKRAFVTLKINQKEVLNIANVPVGTTYTITESTQAGYDLKSIEWEIIPDDLSSGNKPTPSIVNSSITNTIVTNHDNHVTYTNKTNVTDITICKVDEAGDGLEGAVFRLIKVGENDQTETLASDIGSVSGLDTVTKTVSGSTVSFDSSIETTGEVQKIFGLPDGTYRLYEVYVPAGYISTYRYIQFTIENRVMKDVMTDEGVLAEDSDEIAFIPADGNILALVTVTNIAGAALPHTGGIGTTIFYIFGSMLVIGCGIYLIARRRAAR